MQGMYRDSRIVDRPLDTRVSNGRQHSSTVGLEEGERRSVFVMKGGGVRGGGQVNRASVVSSYN